MWFSTNKQCSSVKWAYETRINPCWPKPLLQQLWKHCKMQNRTVMALSLRRKNLMWISVNDRLLFEFQLTRVLTISLYTHCTIVITVQLSQYEIIDWWGNLTKRTSMSNYPSSRVNVIGIDGNIPYSIGKLLHHQIPKLRHQQGQAELNDPKICSWDCYLPKISILCPDSDRQRSWDDDWPDTKIKWDQLRDIFSIKRW